MIRFFREDTKFVFKKRRNCKRWLEKVAGNESRRIGDINIIFCSDSYILELNRKSLSHDYYTDIITFDYCEGDVLSGDLFISVDTVRENAVVYGAASFVEELDRVIVHGVLHLVGYDDRTASQQKTMREKEDYYLSLKEQ